MLALLKTVITKKLRSRNRFDTIYHLPDILYQGKSFGDWPKQIHVHSRVEDLFDHFPRSVLPTEYGGELINCISESWLRTANKEYAECTIEGQPNLY
ncbi:UNVERIFIED_CONTAM: hypothetical protein NCL1_54824 [Trichonephila clavipes]